MMGPEVITHKDILMWLIPIVGFCLIYILNGIKKEIQEVKTTVNSVSTLSTQKVEEIKALITKLEIDLRSGLSSLDRRVADLELLSRIRRGSILTELPVIDSATREDNKNG